MVGSAHNYNMTELVLIAPVWQNLPFVLGSGYCSRDLLDVSHAKRPKLAS